MTVLVAPADRTGCGHYRLIWPAETLPGTVVSREGVSMAAEMWGDRMRSVRLPEGVTTVVIQRPTTKVLLDAVRILTASGVRVIVDMDDDLTCIHPSNPSFTRLRPGNPSGESWRHALDACRAATAVTCSTPELAERMPGRTVVVENRMPAHVLDVMPTREDRRCVVGWPGAVATHPDDLRQIVTPIQTLMRENKIDMRIVGPNGGVKELFGDIDVTGPVKFDDWFDAVSRLDVAVAPLTDTRFNRSKSWLKPLEAAAVGVPCVVSPTPEYVALAEQVPSVLVARRPREWRAILRRLADDETWRHVIADAGRQAVADRFMIADHADEWGAVWQTHELVGV